MSRAIADHGLIGDARSAALVANDGTIDWLCWPRFDSPSLFAALLDTDDAGCWRISPVGAFQSRQRYVDDTNVLETHFTRPEAHLVLTDCMPIATKEFRTENAVPEHELLRVLRCEEGEAEVELFMHLAPSYGRKKARMSDRGKLGIEAETSRGALYLSGEAPLHLTSSGDVVSRFVIRAGEAVRFSLTWSMEAPATLPLLGDEADAAVERSKAWWKLWARRARYQGPYRDAVVRSALALKLLSYAPSGAILAAGTTSLPEQLGGSLNWDYRFCWLRDSAFVSRALVGLGYYEEAASFIHWLTYFTGLGHPRLRVLYDVYGERPAKERELLHLRGYRNSRPVRAGNAAEAQLQLDLYGEVIDAVATWIDAGGEPDREMERDLCQFGKYVCAHWQEADQGIWEPRDDPQHHTHSRLLCWTALDRLIALHDRGFVQKLDVDDLRLHRSRIRRDIETRAWNPKVGAYTGILGSPELDASVALMPWYGYLPPFAPRVVATIRAIQRHLGADHGLVYRNDPLRGMGDNGFVACGYWVAEAIADGCGSMDEACRLFDQLLEHRNEVGLIPEEVVPHTGELVGNFPQAFSHVGLISMALSLEERAGKREQAPGLSAQEEGR